MGANRRGEREEMVRGREREIYLDPKEKMITSRRGRGQTRPRRHDRKGQRHRRREILTGGTVRGQSDEDERERGRRVGEGKIRGDE